MLDYRHQSFLALCTYKSFTKAAEHLHITQPAVSQHIKYLEDYYNCQLINTSNRKIKLTQQGELLREFATTVYSDSKHLKGYIQTLKAEALQFNFGATLSIGEYVMPKILSNLLTDYPDMTFHMVVANTKTLLEQLNNGELDFIIVEGLFDKSKYDTTLFSLENFIPVCSTRSGFSNRPVSFEELQNSRLILREEGSGTREILEHILYKRNYSLHMFDKIIEIGNMAAIKKMVFNEIGITFLFEVAAENEIEAGRLSKINIIDFSEQREFNFVTLKDSFFKEEYHEIFQMLKNEFEANKK